MHIQQAKEEIRNALRAYLSQDEKGNYLYPTVRQRPLLLMGPPGVGKTAIVEQIAREEKLPLVAYTIDPPHPAERGGPAQDSGTGLLRQTFFRDGIYHE